MRSVMRQPALGLLVLVTACTSSSSTNPSSSAATGGGDSSSSSAGSGEVVVGGSRPVKLVVPGSYDGSKPVPLVVLLHGYSATGFVQEAYFKLTAQAEKHGFLYAIPEGTKDSEGLKFWNASDACCNFGNVDVDDSAYLAGVIDEIKKAYNVDPKRVHFIGHSNGGFMSFRMACDHAEVVASIVSLAGAMPSDATKCKATEPVSVLQVHGDADATVLYEGGKFASASYPSARESVLQWTKTNGCSATPDTSLAPLDLEMKLAGAETSIERYGDCMPGGAAELWTIAKGGHLPNLSTEFAPRAIEFLLSHPKP
jgi:polyhydroxybutyrate depolymerase